MIRVRISGMKRALRELQRFRERSDRAMVNELAKMGRELLRQSRARAPEDEGRLKDSGRMYTENNGWTVVVEYTAPHAPYVEFGTGGYASRYLGTQPPDVRDYAATFLVSGKGTTPAQPFLYPPFLVLREQIAPRLDAVLQKEADKFNSAK